MHKSKKAYKRQHTENQNKVNNKIRQHKRGIIYALDKETQNKNSNKQIDKHYEMKYTEQ